MRNEEGLAKPFLSVVIASVNGTPYIVECLEHLTSQRGEIPFEVLLMDCCDEPTRMAIRSGFPQPEVVLVEVEGRPSIPKLRAMGMDRAKGRMVAILGDHCNVPPDWFLVIERAHKEGHQAIGGAVENGASGRLVNWANDFGARLVAADRTSDNSAARTDVEEALTVLGSCFGHQRPGYRRRKAVAQTVE